MKVNVSIDDVSPHPKSSVRVLDRCFELIKIFPKIKFSLFVPVAYWRTVRPEIATRDPLIVSHHPEFIESLLGLPDGNFELCYHGLFHGIPGSSDNDEFQNLNYNQARDKFEKMFEIVKTAGMFDKFKPVFRPPAWRMSPEAISAAEDAGIQILALSPKQYAKDTYKGRDESFKKVIYYNSNPPLDPLFVTENLEVVYHACEWDRNYLSESMRSDLIEFLSDKNVEFCFMSEMV